MDCDIGPARPRPFGRWPVSGHDRPRHARASNFLILFSAFSPTPLTRTANIRDAARGREQRREAEMRAVCVVLASAALLTGGTASAAPQFCPEARAVVKAIYDPGDGHSFGPPKRVDLSAQEF